MSSLCRTTRSLSPASGLLEGVIRSPASQTSNRRALHAGAALRAGFRLYSAFRRTGHKARLRFSYIPNKFPWILWYPFSSAHKLNGTAAKSSTNGIAFPSFVKSMVRKKCLHVSQHSIRICGNCSATKTGSFCSASSPHFAQKIRRNSHSSEQNEQSKNLFPPSPSGRNTPSTGRLVHRGHRHSVITGAGGNIAPVTNSAYGCSITRAKKSRSGAGGESPLIIRLTKLGSIIPLFQNSTRISPCFALG